MNIQRDYTVLRFKRHEGSYLSPLLGTERLVFEEKPRSGSLLMSILLSGCGPEVSVLKSEFDAEFRDLRQRVWEIESGWQYNWLINFDSKELDGLQAQYKAMEKIKDQLAGRTQVH